MTFWPLFPVPRIECVDTHEDYVNGYYEARFESEWTAADADWLASVSRACTHIREGQGG